MESLYIFSKILKYWLHKYFMMRTRVKFIKTLAGYSLKNIKQLEVQFDPFHPNALNVREFWAGITDYKQLKTNPQVATRTKIVSDGSDPLVTVHFLDNHKLVLNGKHMESGHFLELIEQFGRYHQNVDED